ARLFAARYMIGMGKLARAVCTVAMVDVIAICPAKTKRKAFRKTLHYNHGVRESGCNFNAMTI
ncbi:MAG: hypothetical protein LIO94_11285, partial [Clostridiales bacterium]|nr:hypothetical protein [Clostridiales bacterium]